MSYVDKFSVGLRDKHSKAAQGRPPARPPLHQPSVFPGYLIYIFNTLDSPEKIAKKILEQELSLSQN
jgi:hypothetical protein